MLNSSVWLCRLFTLAIALWCFLLSPAYAAKDPYITKYLKVTEPVALELDADGATKTFSPEQLTSGKQLFERNCLNCHVAGGTLSNPTVSLSLKDLQGATPPRDTINALVEYMRHPLTYDGSEDTIWCREVPESWLAQADIENLAGFVLRAAQTAPGWGVKKFTDEPIQ
ncbi:MAG TPA: photosystem II cytochrome PsbV2 [Leptolyngbyaceae cyanobacterium M33_DOE_097]|uniref:Photosystem II cytochrome PsbV2 n=1 Tax=Oscillatoriales cyanobacterium SpSt-418 TaxID=2282169 RepID=A0A7C3KEA2_9CYAN|nr:photosystem II cytochrome PsbV2 [Leptolyngbyaceae cyanobacterium M33_DOE_097]